MLLSLNIKNIALIEDVKVDFSSGFHVLSGETGAGKSIVVDALNLIVGERADRGLIRSGSQRASVEAIIDVSNNEEVISILSREMIDYSDNIINVTRVIADNGRNICRISGETVSLQTIIEIMKYLIDLHGQHAHQSLLNVDKHREYLDDMGNDQHASIMLKVSKAYREWYDSSIALGKLRKLKKDKDMQYDLTKKQLKELDDLNIKFDEEEKLIKKKDEIDSFYKISESLKFAYYNLYSAGNDESIIQKLILIIGALDEIANINEEFANIRETVKNSYYELEEVAIELRDLKEGRSFDEDEQQRISDRLDQVKRAKRKYGSFDEIQKLHTDLQERMDSFVSIEDDMKNLEAIFKHKLKVYRELSEELKNSRNIIAEKFEKQMAAQLNDLGMSNTIFKVVFHEDDSKKVPTQFGNDKVEFFISPNLGEPLKPLSLTASGGELSRLMLALKTISADKNRIPCMIFDEIDTGISGNAAKVVAEKIAVIAKYRQVLCVTHLAQIAAMADNQYFVEKYVVGSRTLTNVVLLDKTAREREVARLLGVIGDDDTTGTSHAKILLEYSEKFKNTLIEETIT